MIVIFKENEAIFVAHGTIGAWPIGCLQAVGNGDGTISVLNRAKTTADEDAFKEIADRTSSDFVDANGAPYGASEAATVNALNALFSESALAPPTITSALAVPVATGTPVNYELTGDGIVGVEWGSLPAGLAVSSLNRRIITGQIVTPGTYSIPVTVTNTIGATSATIVATVTSSFADTKSVRFNNQDYMQMSPPPTTTDRAGNGSGVSDAWSIACWYKGSTSNNNSQTIWCFGSSPLNSQGNAWLYYTGKNNGSIELRYGTNFNRLIQRTATATIPQDQWRHILVTYDGGTTGAGSTPAEQAAYHSRFNIYIDGSLVTTTNSNTNNGYTGSIVTALARLARTPSGQYSRGSLINEVAMWSSDQSANVAAIYNSGVPHDLLLLATTPDHWYRMGDGDTFPTMQDNAGSSDGTLFNMTSADIVNDAP